MSKAKQMTIALVVLAVLLGGVIVLTIFLDRGKGNTDSNAQATSEPAVTIVYSQDGFTPNKVTVAADSYIKIVNESDGMVGPWPDEGGEVERNDELIFSDAAPGESVQAQVKTKGTWGLRNYYNSDHRATVVVE